MKQLVPGGYVHVGLYHRYGRAPLLDAFEKFRVELMETEDQQKINEIVERAYRHWIKLFNTSPDDTLNLSWFRDQCLHPYETQWTLSEILIWFEELGIEPEATSLNRYETPSNWSEITNSEHMQREVGKRYLSDGVYFPGFFYDLWLEAVITKFR